MNVWEQPGWSQFTTGWDDERWIAAGGGSVLALVGWKRGGWLGNLLAFAGAGLALRAAQGYHDLTRARLWIDNTLRSRGWRSADIVHDASEESFPASDAPSWTPTSGATTRQ